MLFHALAKHSREGVAARYQSSGVDNGTNMILFTLPQKMGPNSNITNIYCQFLALKYLTIQIVQSVTRRGLFFLANPPPVRNQSDKLGWLQITLITDTDGTGRSIGSVASIFNEVCYRNRMDALIKLNSVYRG